jgi:hypothetical protein
MSFSREEYLEIFIEHFIEFVEDVGHLYYNDDKVQLLKEGIIWTAENNKEKVINAWKKYVCDNFRKEIEANDYKFFTESRDWEKVITHRNKDLIISKLTELRQSISELNIENKMKALKYVENLVKLCDLYNSPTTI